MKIRQRSVFWRRVARRLGQAFFRLAENNEDPCIASNGERWLLRKLLRKHAAGGANEPMVIIDAGANTGGYTREVLRVARDACCPISVHMFEPSPHCEKLLQREFAAVSGVRIVASALAEHAGRAVLYHGKAGSSQASLVARPGLGEDPAGAISVPLLRLDDYFLRERLSRVDLLKLDVEGFELQALQGAGERLTPRVIDVIQFEYGGTTMDSGGTLRGIYNFLGARGYVMAKLFPSALEVRSYAPWMEHYAYANYVALSPRWLDANGGSK